MPDSIDEERLRKILFSIPEKAIRLLYNLYGPSLVNISEGFTHNRKASEDIVQETFVHVWRNHEWLGRQRYKSIVHYLVKVVKNKSITFYKKEMRLALLRSKYIHDHHFSQFHFSGETDIISREVYSEFRQLIATFPLRERQCFLMRLDDEMTNKQIAEYFMISVKAVERSLTSAKKRLKKHWGKLR
jgi:RNA polymerase sigma factor (sigma-70 family)